MQCDLLELMSAQFFINHIYLLQRNKTALHKREYAKLAIKVEFKEKKASSKWLPGYRLHFTLDSRIMVLVMVSMVLGSG